MEALERLQEAVQELRVRGQVLEERVSRIELSSTEASRCEAHLLGDLEARFAEERELGEGRLGFARAALEAQLQTHCGLVQERISDFQETLSSATSKQASAHAAVTAIRDELRGELDRREGYMLGFQERLSGIERKLEQDLQSEREAQEARFSELRQLLSLEGDGLRPSLQTLPPEEEQRLVDHLAASVLELLASERAALQEHRARWDDSLAGERAQREQLARDLQAHVGRLEHDLRGEESARRSELGELREMLRGERLSREAAGQSLRELLASEKAASEGHLRLGARSRERSEGAERLGGQSLTNMMASFSSRLDDLERTMDPLIARHRPSFGEDSAITSTPPEMRRDLWQRAQDGDAGGGGPRRVQEPPEFRSSSKEVAPCLSARAVRPPVTVLPPPTALVQTPEAAFPMPFTVVAGSPRCPAIPSPSVPGSPGASLAPRFAYPVAPGAPCVIVPRPANIAVLPQPPVHAAVPVVGSPGGPWPPPAHIVTRQVSRHTSPGKPLSARASVVRTASAGR